MNARSGARPRNAEACREAALSLLDSRPFTRRRLETKLRARHFPPDIVRAVLDDLERAGIIDDFEYARAYVAEVTAPRGRAIGRRKIVDNLVRRGVPRHIAEQAAAESAAVGDESQTTPATGELERALTAATERWRRILRQTPHPGPRERARLIRFLASRGFLPDVVREAARRVIDEEIDEFPPGDE